MAPNPERFPVVALLMLGGLSSLVLGILTVSMDCPIARIGVDIWLSFVYIAAVLMIAVEDKVNYTVKRAFTFSVMISGAVQVGVHIGTLIRTLQLPDEDVANECVPINAVLVIVASTMLFVGVVFAVMIRRN